MDVHVGSAAADAGTQLSRGRRLYELLCEMLNILYSDRYKYIASGVDVNYEVPERSGKIISTGTPFRLVYGVIHL